MLETKNTLVHRGFKQLYMFTLPPSISPTVLSCCSWGPLLALYAKLSSFVYLHLQATGRQMGDRE